jgi:hypothetical protein
VWLLALIKALPGRSDERFQTDSAHRADRCGREPHNVSVLSIVIDRDDGEESGCRQLLALHGMRRGLECLAFRDRFVCGASMALTTSEAVRELLELVAALDRRVPRVERAGEAAIARDAAVLRILALKRIEELERDVPAFPREVIERSDTAGS